MTDWNQSRRRFLTTAAGLGIGGLSGVASGDLGRPKAVVLKGNMTKPITENDIAAVRGRQLEAVGIDPVEQPMPVVKESSGKVVGYACRVSPDGNIEQTINIAGDRRDVPKAHARATEVAEALNRGDDPFGPNGGSSQ
jgi:hypothetical protein